MKKVESSVVSGKSRVEAQKTIKRGKSKGVSTNNTSTSARGSVQRATGSGVNSMTKNEETKMMVNSFSKPSVPTSKKKGGRRGKKPKSGTDADKKEDFCVDNSYEDIRDYNYFVTMKCYLAHSDTVSKYKQNMIDRIQNREVRPNLYAMVLPGGHGKTYLSERYGFIDVDNLTGGEHEQWLYQMRRELVRSNSAEWNNHNREWYNLLNLALSMMTFEEPTVVLVHSEECAVEIGATLIGVFVLDDAEFEWNIDKRNLLGRIFSRVSREFVLRRSLNDIVICRTNEEIEASVIATCNYNRIPVPAPYKYTREYRNNWYGRSVPEWLLKGEVENKRSETDLVLTLAKQNMIPKCCVDHFVRANSPSGKAYGYGVSMNEWAAFFGDAVGAMRCYADEVDPNGDMFEIFPPESEAEKNRVNVTIRRLMGEVDIWQDDFCKLVGGYHTGERHVFVAGLLCHWLGIGKHLSIAEKFGPLYFVKFDEWGDIMGRFHNLIRLSDWYCTTPITEEERQSMMYMNMLTGRQMYVADWVKVVEERKEGNKRNFLSYDPIRKLWTRMQYLEDFDESLEEAYSNMFTKPRPINVENFVQFWRRRRTWVAKGSTVLNQLPKEMLSYTISFLDEMDKVISMRHNKKSLFENHEILGLIKETEESWNATKVVPKLNETGKKRELLPGTLMHYLVFSYVLYVAEAQAKIGSTRLNVNNDEDWAYYDRKMEEGLHHMLYDWANFNAQHTKDDMAKVINKLAEIPAVPADYAYFCRAIAESFYHMYLIDPEGGRHKLEKGLYSGWRGTTWINTVLNFVYVSIGVKCCERIYSDFDPVYFDHGGDDLDVGFKNAQDCYRMIDVMNAIGYEATDIKQMIAKKAEFYRVTITERGVFSSPTRALANFVSGNWESGGAKTLVEKTASILDQVAKLTRRGVDERFSSMLSRIALSHWLKIKSEDEWFELKKEVMHSKTSIGGLGIPDSEGMLWVVKPGYTEVLEKGLNVKLPGVYCSEDHVKVVEEELDRLGLKLHDKKGLVNKLAKQSYDLKGLEERKIFMEMNKQEVEVVSKELAVVPKWNENLMKEFFRWVGAREDEISLKYMESMKEFIGHIYHGDKALSMKELVMLYVGARLSDKVINFKGNMYYRRLVPDFISASIEKYILWSGDKRDLPEAMMDEYFCTLCYMCSEIYSHRN